MTRTDGKENREAMRGCIYEGALKKVGGDPAGLEKAIQEGRVVKQTCKGLSAYFFPEFDFSKVAKFEQNLSGEKRKLGDSGDYAKLAEAEMEFDWEPNALVAGSSGCPPLALTWAVPPTPTNNAGMPRPDDAPSPDLLYTNDLSRAGAGALKMLAPAEKNIDKVKTVGEQDLLKRTMLQLKEAALLGEELTSPLGRAIKFKTVEGGFTTKNVTNLSTQAQEASASILTCMKLLKAILLVV